MQYEKIQRILTAMELRRDRLLDQVEMRAEAFAWRLRKTFDEIIDARFDEVPPLAAE